MRTHRAPCFAACLTTLSLASLAITSPIAAQQSAADKLIVHGYLTQGYAKSNGQQLIGIDKEGTSDYRRAALLTRYELSSSDAVVLQFAHRRLGRSATTQFEDNVNIDWAFYEKRFSTGTSFRVGKAPIPYGISNETRYVGTLMPFYRLPYNFYFEGSYTSETVNGVVLKQEIAPSHSFNATVNVYGGDWKFLEYRNRAPAFVVNQARAEQAVGVQAFVNTPIDGLRFGIGGLRHKTYSEIRPGNPVLADAHVSAELQRERFFLRSEARQFHYANHDTLSIKYGAYYVQGGVQATSRIGVNAQAEVADIKIAPPYVPAAFGAPVSRDNAVGLTVKLAPSVMVKLENHWNRGYTAERVYSFGYSQPADKTLYQIVSLSASF